MQQVLVYNFADLKLLHQIETQANTNGLVAISSTAESTVLTCPGLHTGQVGLKMGAHCGTPAPLAVACVSSPGC